MVAAGQPQEEHKEDYVSFKESIEQIELPFTGVLLAGLIVGALLMASGIGLVTRKQWGRVIALLVATIAPMMIVASLFSWHVSLDPGTMLGFFGYFFFCYVWLFRRKIVAEFR